MQKLVIAVKSCHSARERGMHDAIRATWGRDLKALGVPTYFFLGADPTQQDTRRLYRYTSDEIVIDSKDDYMSLPFKTRKIAEWITNKLFQHVFLCDTDTLIMPKKLLSSGFEQYDYAGRICCGHSPGEPPFSYKDEHGVYPYCAPWFSGGFGYFLSRPAAQAVAATYPELWAEDMYVGRALAGLIYDGEMKAQAISMGTDHWPKCATAWDPKFMKVAYETGDFRDVFRKGHAIP